MLHNETEAIKRNCNMPQIFSRKAVAYISNMFEENLVQLICSAGIHTILHESISFF